MSATVTEQGISTIDTLTVTTGVEGHLTLALVHGHDRRAATDTARHGMMSGAPATTIRLRDTTVLGVVVAVAAAEALSGSLTMRRGS